MLNLTHVRSFVAVTESGNYRDASRRLVCSQPTVSQHIMKLEAVLDAVLVVRDRQRCSLTPEGKLFLPFARSLLSVAERAQNVLRDRVLSVGASGNIGTYLLQPFLQSFKENLDGDVRIDVWIGPNPDVAERLTNHEIDVGIMEWWDDRPHFTAMHWRQEPLVIIFPPDHPWAAKQSLDIEELLDAPMIGGETGSGTGRIIRNVFGADADKLRVELQLGSTEAVKHAVKAGLGVSLVMESAVREELRGGTLCARPLSGSDIKKQIYVVQQADQPTLSLAPQFAEHLINA
ncbi:MAG: LysR family transcriptional regulator [Pseudomonadota bacterium]